MTLTTLRARERAELCETLRAVGPDAPTLCGDWSAADVAAHLVVSEAFAGLPMVVGYNVRRVLPARVTRRLLQSAQSVGGRQMERVKARGWNQLVSTLAAGSPVAYRLRTIAPIRLIEEWIHHEDVRRANGLPARASSPELDEALWNAGLVLTALPEFRFGREGVRVVLPDGRTQLLGDTERMTVEGSPGEVLLFLSGRTNAARVSTSGDEAVLGTLTLNV